VRAEQIRCAGASIGRATAGIAEVEKRPALARRRPGGEGTSECAT